MAENHGVKLGRLVSNLHSLESLLRMYLLNVAHKSGLRTTRTEYWNLNVGDSVDVDEFTNYDALGALVSKFNTDVATRDKSLTLDTAIVTIRDLIAHGRVASTSDSLADMRIVKFGQPRGGKVEVGTCALMDDAWFDAGIKLSFDQLVKVHTAHEKFAA